MGFTFTRKKTLKDDRCLVTIYYFSLCMDSRILIIDSEAVFNQGHEVKQIVNGRLHYCSVNEV